MNLSRLAVPASIALILTASIALAYESPKLSADCCDPPARWGDRYDRGEARFSITTETNDATLLLVDDVVAVQLSDRLIKDIRRKTKDERKDEEDNILAQALKTAVLSGVRELLSHSAECPLREVKDVTYRDGKLTLVTRGGARLFENFDVNERSVLEGFSSRDARAFVREFHQAKRSLK